MTFDAIKAIDCVIIMLLSLLFLFLIFMFNINELLLLLLLLFLTLNIVLNNHIVLNATLLTFYFYYV